MLIASFGNNNRASESFVKWIKNRDIIFLCQSQKNSHENSVNEIAQLYYIVIN